MTTNKVPADLSQVVATALAEDIGSGDITATQLPEQRASTGQVICREPAVLCGRPWFDDVFQQLGGGVDIAWQAADGDSISAGQVVCRLSGPSRTLLTGERTALNFLQLLSATATTTRHFVDVLRDYETVLLDTRKTLPGLRTAQKYAVRCGGGNNHRMGLYDALLLKENHIVAAGGIEAALANAQRAKQPVEIEVESLAQLKTALAAGAEWILLDNFDPVALRRAVQMAAGRARLEVSGGMTLEQVREIAATGVDYISVGALTKNVRAIDYSMRLSAL